MVTNVTPVLDREIVSDRFIGQGKSSIMFNTNLPISLQGWACSIKNNGNEEVVAKYYKQPNRSSWIVVITGYNNNRSTKYSFKLKGQETAKVIL